MKRSLLMIAVTLAAWSTDTALAHDGVDHAQAGATVANASTPHWLGESRLHVGKALQQRLALRTASADGSDGQRSISLSAEVLQHPATAGTLNAVEYGRIESDDTWPLAGQSVSKGQILGWLRPVLSVQQESERRRDLALLEQQLQLARINLDRLQVQVQASDGVLATNNVYYDEAVLDVAALKTRIEQANQALDQRTALRASADGVLSNVHVRNGDVVDTGDRLFTVAVHERLRIALTVFDAGQVRQPPRLTLTQPAGALVLNYVGNEPVSDGQGWRLLYDGDRTGKTGTLLPGEIVQVSMVDTAYQTTRPCLRSAAGAELWVQVEPEVFERRRAADCEHIQIAATERWVRDGAAILGQYR